MPTDRYLDLLKQGFMKPLKVRKPRVVKVPAEIVTCVACRNWHPKRKHTASAAQRKSNLAADKAG